MASQSVIWSEDRANKRGMLRNNTNNTGRHFAIGL